MWIAKSAFKCFQPTFTKSLHGASHDAENNPSLTAEDHASNNLEHGHEDGAHGPAMNSAAAENKNNESLLWPSNRPCGTGDRSNRSSNRSGRLTKILSQGQKETAQADCNNSSPKAGAGAGAASGTMTVVTAPGSSSSETMLAQPRSQPGSRSSRRLRSVSASLRAVMIAVMHGGSDSNAAGKGRQGVSR